MVRVLYRSFALRALLALILAVAWLALMNGPPRPAEARLFAGPPLVLGEPKWDLLDPVVAFEVPPQSVIFQNATYTAPPIGVKAIIPALNPDTPVFLMAAMTRPEGGGGLWLLRAFTVDGVLATTDMRIPYNYEDCFGGAPFVSSFSDKIIIVVNCKFNDYGGGNDRIFFPVNTGIVAREPWVRAP